jgi:hypothetical protein
MGSKGRRARRNQQETMNQMQNIAQGQVDYFQEQVLSQQAAVDTAMDAYSDFEFTNPFAGLQNPYAGIQTTFENPAAALGDITAGFTNVAADAQNVAAGMKNVAAGAQNVFAGAQNMYAGLENQYAGMENLYAGLENQYEGMENVFEDATVDTRAAQFQAQQTAQQQANIMQGLRGAAGSSGIAALAQTMASQGQLAAQQQAAGIGQQERQNQMMQMQEASKIQQLQRGEAARLAQQEATGGMSIQQQERAGAARLQEQQAAGAMTAQQMRMQGAAQQQQLQMQGAMALQGMQFQGAMEQQRQQIAGAQQLQNQQIAAAQQLQNQQFQGDMWAQELGVAQQNLMLGGQWEADVLAAEGEAGVQAAQFGQLGTILGMEMGQMAGLQEGLQGAYGNLYAGMGMQAEMYGSQAASSSNMFGNLISGAAQIGAAKITVGACLPKGTSIDVPNGKKLIEDIQAGDTVVGYDGKPVSVLQKHCYKEDPKNTFYNVKIEHDNKVGTVDVGGWHRILNVPAPDIKENVINKEEYKGVEFSYDLLTEDTGYRIDGIPVNSMINELIDLATKINKK